MKLSHAKLEQDRLEAMQSQAQTYASMQQLQTKAAQYKREFEEAKEELNKVQPF